MSSLIVNFPDCGKIWSDSRQNTPEGTITIETQGCPTLPPPGPPPIFGTWEIVAFIIVGVAVAAGFATVRVKAHENKPMRLEQKRLAEKDRLDAQVEIAKARKRCGTCGEVYEPEGVK